MSANKRGPRLTLKTAQALAVKVMGTSKGLAKDKSVWFDLYEMRMGALIVTIRFDTYGSGRIAVSIYTQYGKAIYMLFDPATLEEDFEEEDRQTERERRERLDEWVGGIGPDACKEAIDRAWRRNP